MKWDQLVLIRRELIVGVVLPRLLIIHLGQNGLAEIARLQFVCKVDSNIPYFGPSGPAASSLWVS